MMQVKIHVHVENFDNLIFRTVAQIATTEIPGKSFQEGRFKI